MESEDYGTLLQLLQRSINCLTDQDRNIRKTGIVTLTKELDKTTKYNQIKMLTTTNLAKNLIHTLNDPIEANRELTIALMQKLLKGAQLKRDEVEPIIQALIARINNTPFPQKSQDLRQRLLLLLRQCLTFKEAISFNVPDLSSALAKCLGDPSSNIKQYSCQLIDDLCKQIRTIIGKYATGIVKALSQNLKHNKFQVRKTTLVTLSKLLITEGAGGNFEHVSIGLKVSLSDAKVDVRRASMQCTANLIKYLAPKYLKQHEPTLVGFLLSGLTDQSQQNVTRCIQLLQQCGDSIKALEQGQNQMKE